MHDRHHVSAAALGSAAPSAAVGSPRNDEARGQPGNVGGKDQGNGSNCAGTADAAQIQAQAPTYICAGCAEHSPQLFALTSKGPRGRAPICAACFHMGQRHPAFRHAVNLCALLGHTLPAAITAAGGTGPVDVGALPSLRAIRRAAGRLAKRRGAAAVWGAAR